MLNYKKELKGEKFMNFQDLKLQNDNQISTFTFRDVSGNDHEI